MISGQNAGEGRVLMPASAIPAAAYLSLLVIAPFAMLVVYSFWRADFFSVTPAFTFENFAKLATSPLYRGVLLKTLLAASIASVIAVLVGYVVAYAIVFRFEAWGRRILLLIMASLLASYIVRVYALTTILGTNGLINRSLLGLGLIETPISWLLYGYPTIIIALVYLYMPIVILLLFSGMQGIDTRLFEASRDLGRGHFGTLVHVLLPLSRPAVRTAFFFVFILIASDYVTPRMVGGVDGQMIGTIIADQFGAANNYPFGAALSLAMLAGFAVFIGGFALAERLVTLIARRIPAGLARIAAVSGARMSLPRLPVAETVTIVTLVCLFAPLVTVLVFSFNEARNPGLPYTGVTLSWYGEVLTSPDFHRALLTSVKIAAITILGGVALGLPTAIALAWRDFALKPSFLGLTYLPMIVPGVVLGVALLTILVTLGIRLGYLVTAAAHTMLVLPYVVQTLRIRLERIDPRIIEAAADLGSGRLRVLRTVTLPILLPALLGAGVLAMAMSLDELLVTNFTIGRDVTVPAWIAARMRTGLTPALNAVAILMLVGTLALIGLTSLWLRYLERRATAAQRPHLLEK
ncbi:MAG: ABC transporter permease subunit [Amaricoccus sp.]|uniref:ABC transporter permease subunit n=1 Tax=Amaricoccus sp. TaxID=1872485 RepID=UPI0039E69BC2